MFHLGQVLIFFDLNISLNEITNSLTFKLYTKPTNTFSYLFFTSNHPETIFKNIPKSLFIRIRRICSSFHDYLYFSRILISQLVKRGFNFFDVNKTSNIIAGIKRESFLNYKDRNNDNGEKNTYFNCLYDNSFPNLNNFLKSSWTIFTAKTKNNCFKTANLYLTNSLQTNLKKVFLFDAKPPKKFNYYTTFCHDTNCEICKYIIHYKFIRLKNNFTLPIQNNSNCKSENLIYFIFCLKCNFYYIGQTGRCGNIRIAEHIKDIKNMKLFDKNLSDVSLHFNKPNHDIESDFKFLYYKSNLKEKERKCLESDLINISYSLKANLMNTHIPSLYSINSFSFAKNY